MSLDNIDVGIVRELALLLTHGVLIRVKTAVPEFTVVLRHRIFLTQGSQGVFNIPSTRTLKCMGIHLCPGKFFPFRCGQETDDCITIASLIHFGFPEALICTTRSIVHLLNFFDQFLSQRTKRGLLFEIGKGHSDYLRLVGFGLCVPSYSTCQSRCRQSVFS